MLLSAIRHGLRAIARERLCAVLLWLSGAVLALPIAGLAWWWWSRTALLPESDVLLDHFSLAIMGELLKTGRAQFIAIFPTLFLAIVLALPVGAVVYGGIVTVLADRESPLSLQRFWRGARCCFWRYVALAVIGTVFTAILMVIVAIASIPLVHPLRKTSWEPGASLALAIQLALVVLAMVHALIAFDYARIRVVLNDDRDVLRAWFASLWFVLRHPFATYGLAAVFSLLMLLAVETYVAISARLGAKTMTLVLVTFAIQQAFMLVRSSVRVGLIAGEINLLRPLLPPPVIPMAASHVLDSSHGNHEEGLLTSVTT